MKALNPKQELFSQAVATGASATAAYRSVYGAGKNADVFGPRLMGNDGIRDRVAALQAKAAQACVLTIEKKRSLLAGFALSDTDKTADRIRAIELDAMLAGEMVKKAEVRDTTPRESLNELRGRIATARERHARN